MTTFEEVVTLLEEYKEKNGDCLVPRHYITESGVRLGNIVQSIRTGGRKTSEAEKGILNKLGFIWKIYLPFEEVATLLEEYKEKFGNCSVPFSYVTESGIQLGSIVNHIRCGGRKTSEAEKEILNKLGFVWNVAHSFEEVVILLEEYKEKYGNCLVPQAYVTENGVRLGTIVSNIRRGGRKTSETEKGILNKMGFVWRVKKKTK